MSDNQDTKNEPEGDSKNKTEPAKEEEVAETPGDQENGSKDKNEKSQETPNPEDE